MDNDTMRRIILPELKVGASASVYIEEFLMIGVYDNDDVDLDLVDKYSAQENHWMCRNFSKRIDAIYNIRRICASSLVLWTGGLQVSRALTSLVSTWHPSEVVSVITGNMGEVLAQGDQHPSAPLLHGMDRHICSVTRMELQTFKSVVLTVEAKQTLSTVNVQQHLTSADRQHYELYRLKSAPYCVCGGSWL